MCDIVAYSYMYKLITNYQLLLITYIVPQLLLSIDYSFTYTYTNVFDICISEYVRHIT